MMDKYAALEKYAASSARPKYVKKAICDEVYEAIKKWKEDEFSPEVTELDGLSDPDFVETYKAEFCDTVEHELAEAIEHIVQFVEAHGRDIWSYYEALQKYRKLSETKSLATSPVSGTSASAAARRAAMY